MTMLQKSMSSSQYVLEADRPIGIETFFKIDSMTDSESAFLFDELVSKYLFRAKAAFLQLEARVRQTIVLPIADDILLFLLIERSFSGTDRLKRIEQMSIREKLYSSLRLGKENYFCFSRKLFFQ
jgi:hypothetical protein